MPDTQILRPGGGAPWDYVVPPNAEIILKAVSAVIDGSGAAGPFLPTLVIESDAGEIVAESDAPEVAAGATTRASWFPFVGGTSAPQASSGLATLSAYAESFTSQTITAGTTTTLVWNPILPDASGVFSAGSGSQNHWLIHTDGFYMATVALLPDTRWPTDAEGPVRWAIQNEPDVFIFGGWNSYIPGGSEVGYFGCIGSTFGAIPATFDVQIQNESTFTFAALGGPIEANYTAAMMCALGPVARTS